MRACVCVCVRACGATNGLVAKRLGSESEHRGSIPSAAAGRIVGTNSLRPHEYRPGVQGLGGGRWASGTVESSQPEKAPRGVALAGSPYGVLQGVPVGTLIP